MENFIFIEKGLFIFAETLWAVYLLSAVYFYAAKYVFSQKALKNFKRLKFLHRWVFLPVLLIFTFYELKLGGTLDADVQLLLIILILVNMAGYGVLKTVVGFCIKSLIGKKVMLVICYADDQRVEYSLCYQNKVLTRGCCAKKLWGKTKVESGDVFAAVLSESRPGSKELFDVKLIQ